MVQENLRSQEQIAKHRAREAPLENIPECENPVPQVKPVAIRPQPRPTLDAIPRSSAIPRIDRATPFFSYISFTCPTFSKVSSTSTKFS